MNGKTPSMWRERLHSALTWHAVGTAVMALVVAGLAVRFALDWQAVSDSTAVAMHSKQVELKTLTLETVPLRGLDKRVETTRAEMQDFYGKRIPANYSSIATRIGDLEVKSGVRLSRVMYTQGPPGNRLTEISMDAGIGGQYPQIMKFVNGLERDPTFFVIRAMSLTGQQGGMVNLRLRVSTWLRPADAAASGLPATPKDAGDAAKPSAAGKEGE